MAFLNYLFEFRMIKKMYMLIGILVMPFNALASNDPFVPTDPDVVIEKWSVYPTTEHPKDRIALLLSDAKYPGNSHYYAQAAILITANKKALLYNDQHLYYEAITKQYYHQFGQSASILETLLMNYPRHINARLLLTNVYSAMGKFDLARSMCETLIGKAQSILVAACVLNIDAQEGGIEQIEKSLSSLSALAENYPTNDRETEIYVDEIRASMATQIHDFTQAKQILRQHENETAPVSYWVLWADTQLALNQAPAVLDILGKVVSNTTNQDDALLLRLAIAEKQTNTGSTQWISKIKERIVLRELRQDREHAFDIALYYLELEGDLDTAYKWAKLNWQQAKYTEDANLLARIESKMETLEVPAPSTLYKVQK